MLVTIAALGIVAGMIAATSAAKFPPYKAKLERLGGGLLISGFTLLAFAFPML